MRMSQRRRDRLERAAISAMQVVLFLACASIFTIFTVWATMRVVGGCP